MTAETTISHSSLPVFFFHGVLQDASTGASFAARMAAENRRFVPLTFAFGPVDSIRSLREQVPLAIAQIREVVKDDPDAFADGYVFIAYSQGGAIARAVVEEMDDHKVRTLVSLAGVANGMFFGPQSRDAEALRVFLRELGSELFPPSVFDLATYRSAIEVHSGADSSSDAGGQDGVDSTLAQRFETDFHALALAHPELQQRYSYFNLARSPVTGSWTKSNAFLAELNNVSECLGVEDEKNKARRRDNFLRLDAAHFFASPDDGLLSPWQTSILGQYNEVETLEKTFDKLRVLDVKETREYLDDTYGLRSLDERDGLGLHILPNVPHDNWITDDVVISGSRGFSEIYDEHIRPILR